MIENLARGYLRGVGRHVQLTALSAFAMGIWMWLGLHELLPMGRHLSPDNREIMRITYNTGFYAGFSAGVLVLLGTIVSRRGIRELAHLLKKSAAQEGV